MLRNTADSEADVERFIHRAASSEKVWYLGSASGTASADSMEFVTEEDEPVTVLLFFSDEAYARRCQQAHYGDHELLSMTLFDFLFRWLPGMDGDDLLAGPNWNHEQIGLELEPLELRERIEAALTPGQIAAHAERYRSLTRG